LFRTIVFDKILFRKVVMCLTEGSKIVIDACEAFLTAMLQLPPASSSSSVASTAVTASSVSSVASTAFADRYSTPSPFGSGNQTPFDEVPPIPAKLISILQVSMAMSARCFQCLSPITASQLCAGGGY
jgi:hypothetical protein